MVATEFMDMVKNLQWTNYVGVEDFADRLNFAFSVGFLMIAIVIISLKQYFMSAISCYIATTPGGSDFEKFMENYCWVHGTIPILPGEKMPQTDHDWARVDKTMRLNYYQWVPFILGLQCIMYYIPRIIWQIICYNKAGTDIEHLMKSASDAVRSSPKDAKVVVEHIAKNLEQMIFTHRDYRTGRLANARRKIYNMAGPFFCSKRLGTWLISSYFVIKVLYLINSITQIYLMKRFLGFNESTYYFGYTVLSNIASGINWESSRTFPRVTYCRYADVRHLGAQNKYVAQCVLPINMLNEKIYIFLWFWTVIVAAITLISIPTWLIRMYVEKNRSHLVKKYLRMSDHYDKRNKPVVKRFVTEFLRHDGVFLVRMLSVNAGDIITTDIVTELWNIYMKDYKNKNMLKDVDDGDESMAIKLNSSNEGQTKRRLAPNAPSSNGSIKKEPFPPFV